MIVDCHTHIDTPEDDSVSSHHLAASATADYCIVLAGAKEPSKEANQKVVDYVAKNKGKMIGFAVINPAEDEINPKYISSITEKQGLAGLVLYCSACGFHPAHSRAMRLYSNAQKLGLPVFFHNAGILDSDAVLDYSQPYLLDEIAREFGELKIVIGNMGLPFVDQTLSMVLKHKNVYADLTIDPKRVWQVYNMIVAAYERDVMKKLLFGSGFPCGKADECIEVLLGFNKLLADTNLPNVPRDNIRNIIERDTLALLGIGQ